MAEGARLLHLTPAAVRPDHLRRREISSNSPGGVYAILGADLLRPENRYLNVPLIRLVTAGRLPKAALTDYAILRWPFQARADLAMMISHVAFLAGDDAHHLLENAFDEILRPPGEGDHPGLWVQFARRLGATDEELAQAARSPLAEVAGFPLTMTYYCDTPLKIARACRAAMATLWAWREMRQGIARELARRHPAIAAA
jgi:hypothetical protein